MKKKLLTALMCSLVFITTGCGNEEVMVVTPDGDAVIRENGNSSANSSKTPQKEKETTQKTAEKNNASSDLIHVGFAQVGAESDWRLAQTQSMKQTFS